MRRTWLADTASPFMETIPALSARHVTIFGPLRLKIRTAHHEHLCYAMRFLHLNINAHYGSLKGTPIAAALFFVQQQQQQQEDFEPEHSITSPELLHFVAV